ncbi:MAG: hypothetical protein RDU13_11200, partial [Elusimicrobiales bacterium]|nr:hypothetical protein [Elusimicrobiales bacterium]
MPELPPHSEWLDPPGGPEGMKMELWADSSDLEEGAMPDFPVKYGYSRYGQVRLLERSVPGAVEELFDRPMKPALVLRLEPGYNTNPGTYRTRIDTDDDGVLDGWATTHYSTGTFTFGADATAVIAAGHLSGMRHFNQWVPVGEAQYIQSDNINVVI